jgi:hypothetical protein
VAGLIGKIEAKEVGNGRISLRRPAYPESVLDFVWLDRPHLRTELKKWLTELPGNPDLDDIATENAGHTLIELAIRHDDDSAIKYAANSWATGGQMNLAAVALTEAALNASTGRAVRRHMYEWADRVTTDLRLQLTIANVCGGPFGKNYPRNAMTQCHLACFGQVCCLRFCEVDERDGGRGIVAGAPVAGSFHAVGVVPSAFDDAGVGALAPLVEFAGAGDVGHDLFQGAAGLVRGGKPGRRPGGGRRGWCASA